MTCQPSRHLIHSQTLETVATVTSNFTSKNYQIHKNHIKIFLTKNFHLKNYQIHKNHIKTFLTKNFHFYIHGLLTGHYHYFYSDRKPMGQGCICLSQDGSTHFYYFIFQCNCYILVEYLNIQNTFFLLITTMTQSAMNIQDMQN